MDHVQRRLGRACRWADVPAPRVRNTALEVARSSITPGRLGTRRCQSKRTRTRGCCPPPVRCSTFCTECLGHEGSKMAIERDPGQSRRMASVDPTDARDRLSGGGRQTHPARYLARPWPTWGRRLVPPPPGSSGGPVARGEPRPPAEPNRPVRAPAASRPAPPGGRRSAGRRRPSRPGPRISGGDRRGRDLGGGPVQATGGMGEPSGTQPPWKP